jgi:hypothetical protein
LSSRFTFQFDMATDYDLARLLGIDFRAITTARNLATRQANGETGWAPQLRELLAFAKVTKIFGLDTALANLVGKYEDFTRAVSALDDALGLARCHPHPGDRLRRPVQGHPARRRAEAHHPPGRLGLPGHLDRPQRHREHDGRRAGGPPR